jgi:hypothetical protein
MDSELLCSDPDRLPYMPYEDSLWLLLLYVPSLLSLLLCRLRNHSKQSFS